MFSAQGLRTLTLALGNRKTSRTPASTLWWNICSDIGAENGSPFVLCSIAVGTRTSPRIFGMPLAMIVRRFRTDAVRTLTTLFGDSAHADGNGSMACKVSACYKAAHSGQRRSRLISSGIAVKHGTCIAMLARHARAIARTNLPPVKPDNGNEALPTAPKHGSSGAVCALWRC